MNIGLCAACVSHVQGWKLLPFSVPSEQRTAGACLLFVIHIWPLFSGAESTRVYTTMEMTSHWVSAFRIWLLVAGNHHCHQFYSAWVFGSFSMLANVPCENTHTWSMTFPPKVARTLILRSGSFGRYGRTCSHSTWFERWKERRQCSCNSILNDAGTWKW